MQAGLILVAEQTGTIVKTYAGSNRLHTVHPSTTAFNAYVHTYTHVSHFAGIEMAATDLSPIITVPTAMPVPTFTYMKFWKFVRIPRRARLL